MSEDKKQKLWGGRFSDSINPILDELNASIKYDKALWHEDIQGSIVYSKALLNAGLLTKEEQAALEKGLKDVEKEWLEGSFELKSSDEDIHTANERRLKEIVGPVGGKLHTGRSRNDQVALDLRLWVKKHVGILGDLIKQVIVVLSQRAKDETDVLMPGYTHLQRAQAIRWSHWLMSHAWALKRDLERLRFVYWSADICPLGSGALAGNPFSVDRNAIALDLGFTQVTPNSLLAVADRDFVAEYLFWCSLTSCHLSRLAEDLTLYSTSEFAFVKLSDAYSTGSSLMPQKKNPDSVELIRGKAGRMLGNLTGFLSVMKGLPSTYNKDLQEDKEALFDSANTLEAILQVAAGTVATLKLNKTRCGEALTQDMMATDLAYYLVRNGMPFREAHEKAGSVVQKAEELNCSLSGVPIEELQKISSTFTPEVEKIWSFEHSVEQYKAIGGTALSSVNEQIEKLTSFVENFKITS